MKLTLQAFWKGTTCAGRQAGKNIAPERNDLEKWADNWEIIHEHGDANWNELALSLKARSLRRAA
jgi:hypothetical protein